MEIFESRAEKQRRRLIRGAADRHTVTGYFFGQHRSNVRERLRQVNQQRHSEYYQYRIKKRAEEKQFKRQLAIDRAKVEREVLQDYRNLGEERAALKAKQRAEEYIREKEREFEKKYDKEEKNFKERFEDAREAALKKLREDYETAEESQQSPPPLPPMPRQDIPRSTPGGNFQQVA